MSGSPQSSTPRIVLEGLDLAGDPEREAEELRRQEEDEAAAQRERELEELRRQLTRNHQPIEQRYHDKLIETAGNDSPESSKDVRSGRRKAVQWVGLNENDRTDELESRAIEREQASANHPGHIALPIPATSTGQVDGFFDGLEAGSDGMRTPSLAHTPEGSRPGTPDEALNIPSGERDGLPISSTSSGGRTTKFVREAAKLVTTHKAKSLFMTRRPGHSAPSSGDVSPAARQIRGVTSAKRSLYDDDIPAGAQRPSTGGGVLSALLKLYEQPQSNYSSQATLVPSRSGSPTGLATPPHDTSPATAANNAQQPEIHRAPTTLPPTEGFSESKRQRSNPQIQNLFREAASKLSDYRQDVDRPAAAKSKAGVFGALQASALSLAGAATPTGSTVAPAPQRPGYKLGRHSLPEVPTNRTLSQSVPSSTSSSPLTSPRATPSVTPPLEHPGLHQRKTGSHLNLTSLGKLPGQVAELNKDIARKSESIAREHLRPDRYHHQSAALRAKTSSTPGTPVSEYPPEKNKGGLRRKKDKRRQEEIFITMHVAAILQRQDFILRLARALMMFGAPSHRLEYQIQQTAKVLEIDCQVIYIVNFLIVSFSDPATHTSEIRFIKQAAGLDLGKLTDIAILHWEVVHDKIGVEEASIEISNLMKAKPHYNNWWLVAFGAWCSCMISIAAFNASFIDMLVIAPLGAILVAVQCFIAARSDILSSIFEIVIAAIISFVASALASTRYFCYAAITSSSIVLILPGWPVCVAALELQTRSIVSGSVRIVYAVVYSLFLGFGISLGANIWELVSSQAVYTANDNSCSGSHPVDGAWYRVTLSQWFFFLAVPGFPLGLALRNQARFNKELFVMVIIAGVGWTANHFSTYGFPGRSDISSALGALVVGLLGNIWGKFFQSTAFIVACVPILFQLPSGLGNGGLLNFATTSTDSTAVFSSGWSVAQQLITVVIGLVVGLLCSCALIYPFGKRRGGLMTF